MDIITQLEINSNPNLKKYLKTHSYWYKYLNRNPNYIKNMDNEMKKEYKLTTCDKIQKISADLNLLSNIIKILK